jgi:hypothetical protein
MAVVAAVAAEPEAVIPVRMIKEPVVVAAVPVVPGHLSPAKEDSTEEVASVFLRSIQAWGSNWSIFPVEPAVRAEMAVTVDWDNPAVRVEPAD